MNQFIFAVALRSIEVEIGNWIETFNFFIHLENIQIDETYIWKTLKLLHIWWFGEQEVSHWCCRTGLCSEFMWTIVIMIGFLGKRSYASTINHGHLALTPLLHLCWGRNVYKQTQTEMINFLAAKIVLGARYKTTQVFAALRWQYQWEIRFQQIAWQQLMNMMILTADPQEILTPFQDWKNWPSDTCVGARTHKRIMRTVNFGLSWPKSGSVLIIFPIMASSWNLQGLISTIGDAFESKTPASSHLSPLKKRDCMTWRGWKWVNKIWHQFCQQGV